MVTTMTTTTTTTTVLVSKTMTIVNSNETPLITATATTTSMVTFRNITIKTMLHHIIQVKNENDEDDDDAEAKEEDWSEGHLYLIDLHDLAKIQAELECINTLLVQGIGTFVSSTTNNFSEKVSITAVIFQSCKWVLWRYGCHANPIR